MEFDGPTVERGCNFGVVCAISSFVETNNDKQLVGAGQFLGFL